MLDLQAALGLKQLEKLDAFNAARTTLAARYDELLADLPEVKPLEPVPYPITHSWHLYVIRLDTAALTLDRNQFMAALQELKIGCGLHYPALHTQSYYRKKYGHTAESLPHAHAAGESVVSLPLFPRMEKRDQDDVVAGLRYLVAGNRRSAP